MNPFHDEHKRRTEANLLSLAITVVFSVLGIYNWMEVRAFIIGMLATLKVNPFAWQGIDNITFLLAGVAWLAYVFYSQHYLKKNALAGRLLPAAALLLALQFWLLFVCRGVPALLGGSGGASGIALAVKGAAALLLTAYVMSTKRLRRRANINHGERG
jgi:hypothetical protein